MGSRGMRICAWAGPLTMVLFGTALMPAAHFLPPPAPGLGAADIAAIYAANSIGIRVGAFLLMVAVGTFMAYTAAVSAAIKAIEGPVAPLSLAQLAGGIVAAFPFLITGVLWTAAAFRADRDPTLVYILDDLSWLFLVMPPSGIIQPVVTAIAILGDKSATPLLPRWLGYFNIWAAILFAPGAFIGFFKTGPFAWDGLLAFWMPATVFGVYTILMSVMLIRASHKVAG